MQKPLLVLPTWSEVKNGVKDWFDASFSIHSSVDSVNEWCTQYGYNNFDNSQEENIKYVAGWIAMFLVRFLAYLAWRIFSWAAIKLIMAALIMLGLAIIIVSVHSILHHPWLWAKCFLGGIGVVVLFCILVNGLITAFEGTEKSRRESFRYRHDPAKRKD